MSLDRIKFKNNSHNIFKYASKHTRTPNKKLFAKECEDVYKLNFNNINTKLRENELYSKFKIVQSIETPELFDSIDRVKQFLPEVVNLINISKSKKIETMLFKRFEHQEYEKVIKKEIKAITEKRDELKIKIIKKREELLNLENKISDMQFSIKTYSDMNKSYLKTDNKKKVFNRFSIKDLSTPQFTPFLNQKSMSNINLTDNFSNIQKEENLNPIKKFNSSLNMNLLNKDKIQGNSAIDKDKISDKNEDEKETKERNLSYERMLIQKGQEITKLKKILPQIKSYRNKLSLEIQNLEHEKAILKNKKENLIEHLYLYFLEILKEGKDTRNEGLSWIIKEIFQLNKKVLISYLPQYLDNHAIEYIFKQARLNLLLEEYENQVKKVKDELVNLNLVKKKNKNKLRIINKKLFYNENDKIKEDINDNNNNINENKYNLKKNLTEISLDRNLMNNKNAQINNYSSRANIFNDYSKFSNTARTDFTNINNDSYYNNTESTCDNYTGKINFITNAYNNENKKNEIYVNINGNNTTNDIEKLQGKERTNINTFRINNHNSSTPKISLKKVLANSMDNNLKNNTFNFINSKKSKKIKISHKILDLYHKKVDLNDINTIPDRLKLAEVNKFLDSKKSKINEKNSGKIEQYFVNNQRIKSIKKKIKELKDNEMKRIFEEYLKKGYHKKYMVEKEILLSALIGEDNVLPELNKQMKESRLYFESLKKCGLINQSFNVNQQINLLNSLLFEKNNSNKNIDD